MEEVFHVGLEGPFPSELRCLFVGYRVQAGVSPLCATPTPPFISSLSLFACGDEARCWIRVYDACGMLATRSFGNSFQSKIRKYLVHLKLSTK